LLQRTSENFSASLEADSPKCLEGAFHSPADKFDEYLPYVREALKTVKWEEGA
jgi:hypothetical protein